jgi:hypothetical protein
MGEWVLLERKFIGKYEINQVESGLEKSTRKAWSVFAYYVLVARLYFLTGRRRGWRGDAGVTVNALDVAVNKSR